MESSETASAAVAETVSTPRADAEKRSHRRDLVLFLVKSVIVLAIFDAAVWFGLNALFPPP